MLRTSVMICQFWMNCDTVLFTPREGVSDLHHGVPGVMG